MILNFKAYCIFICGRWFWLQFLARLGFLITWHWRLVSSCTQMNIITRIFIGWSSLYVKLSDWFNDVVQREPVNQSKDSVFQPIRSKTKTNRCLCTRAFSRAYSPRLALGRNSYRYLALDMDLKKTICQVWEFFSTLEISQAASQAWLNW